MIKLFLISAILLGLGVAGIAIKIWAKKDGEFEGTCSGSNAKLRAKGITCGCGGSGSCQNEGKQYHEHPTELDSPQIQVKPLSR